MTVDKSTAYDEIVEHQKQELKATLVIQHIPNKAKGDGHDSLIAPCSTNTMSDALRSCPVSAAPPATTSSSDIVRSSLVHETFSSNTSGSSDERARNSEDNLRDEGASMDDTHVTNEVSAPHNSGSTQNNTEEDSEMDAMDDLDTLKQRNTDDPTFDEDIDISDLMLPEVQDPNIDYISIEVADRLYGVLRDVKCPQGDRFREDSRSELTDALDSILSVWIGSERTDNVSVSKDGLVRGLKSALHHQHDHNMDEEPDVWDDIRLRTGEVIMEVLKNFEWPIEVRNARVLQVCTSKNARRQLALVTKGMLTVFLDLTSQESAHQETRDDFAEDDELDTIRSHSEYDEALSFGNTTSFHPVNPRRTQKSPYSRAPDIHTDDSSFTTITAGRLERSSATTKRSKTSETEFRAPFSLFRDDVPALVIPSPAQQYPAAKSSKSKSGGGSKWCQKEELFNWTLFWDAEGNADLDSRDNLSCLRREEIFNEWRVVNGYKKTRSWASMEQHMKALRDDSKTYAELKASVEKIHGAEIAAQTITAANRAVTRAITQAKGGDGNSRVTIKKRKRAEVHGTENLTSTATDTDHDATSVKRKRTKIVASEGKDLVETDAEHEHHTNDGIGSAETHKTAEKRDAGAGMAAETEDKVTARERKATKVIPSEK